jgi:predicted O-linked N-acetylglucosamine transferase (SPINDLY family)
MSWHPDVTSLLNEENYAEISQFYEQLVIIEPEISSHYWYLGLAYLLQEKEEDAQSAWFLAVVNQPEETDTEALSEELITVLITEAERQKILHQQECYWLIRQHIFNLSSENIDNILELILLHLNAKKFLPSLITELGLVEVLQNLEIQPADREKLLDLLPKILAQPSSESFNLAQAASLILTPPEWEKLINEAATTAGYIHNKFEYGIELLKLCLDKYPGSLISLESYARFLCKMQRYAESIVAGQQLYEATDVMAYKYAANSIILDALMWSGAWQQIPTILERHKSFIQQFVTEQSDSLALGMMQSLIVKTSILQYFQDKPVENRRYTNDIAQLFCKNIYAHNSFPIPLHITFPQNRPKKIKVGYLSHTLKEHSVGWLCRWLFQYHDREKFEINAYLLGQTTDDRFFRQFLADKFDNIVVYEKEIKTMAEKISQDQVNILVDLDSTTFDYTCTVLSLKPAPVQVTWLGYDASGLPTIDYYLADPYVLPENAQDYYQEKIWRLPHTYVAVDGFEMDVPSLKREALGIPAYATVFLTSQTGLKRNPETVKLQLQIIQKVPNSYLLIKGMGNQETLKSFFLDLADQVGVDHQCLIFLPLDETSYIHRANLQLADIVLDTYPYNGATTTLETLWAGVPVVTLKGQQFASRNTYAFLTQVSVTEGIATSPQEYVDWGIRFGTDESLRQSVAMKLRESRHTSPLWNAKKFTHDVENAYEQMWQQYVDGSQSAKSQ